MSDSFGFRNFCFFSKEWPKCNIFKYTIFMFIANGTYMYPYDYFFFIGWILIWQGTYVLDNDPYHMKTRTSTSDWNMRQGFFFFFFLFLFTLAKGAGIHQSTHTCKEGAHKRGDNTHIAIRGNSYLQGGSLLSSRWEAALNHLGNPLFSIQLRPELEPISVNPHQRSSKWICYVYYWGCTKRNMIDAT